MFLQLFVSTLVAIVVCCVVGQIVSTVAEKASKNKMALCLWDNNEYAVSGNNYEEKFGYLNRNTLVWYDKDFIDAIMASY